jgi:hypothetical protein
MIAVAREPSLTPKRCCKVYYVFCNTMKERASMRPNLCEHNVGLDVTISLDFLDKYGMYLYNFPTCDSIPTKPKNTLLQRVPVWYHWFGRLLGWRHLQGRERSGSSLSRCFGTILIPNSVFLGIKRQQTGGSFTMAKKKD